MNLAAKCVAPAALLFLLTAPVKSAPPLRLLRTVVLPQIRGRIDHFDVDLSGHRLFMSALGNGTLEVFDMRTLRPMRTIRGLHEPQGITYVSSSNRLFVANGGDGVVRIYDAGSYTLVNSIQLAGDADDTRYDPAANCVWVGFGDRGNAGLAALDGSTGKLLETIPLPAHPESFQLASSDPLIYVNIPSAGNIIAVVDRDTRRRVATWTLAGAASNFPMALDEKDQRLYIACRRPAAILVIDVANGRIVARLPCVSSADDLWYGSREGRIYVSGGGGFITVVQRQASDRYQVLAEFPTPAGGRTSLLLPGQRRLYLGIWGRAGRPEELQAYSLQP